MKNRLISGILFLVLGILIAVGPQTIFPVCGIHTGQSAAQSSDQTSGGKCTQMGGCKPNADAEKGSAENAAAGSGTVMKCFWTARAELGIGILIAVLGILLIAFRSAQVRLGLSISLALNGILALLIPNVLIGVCSDAHSTCRMLTLPALTILSGVAIAAAAANAAYLFRSDRKRQAKP